jgi:hypothetical protein
MQSESGRLPSCPFVLSRSFNGTWSHMAHQRQGICWAHAAFYQQPHRYHPGATDTSKAVD